MIARKRNAPAQFVGVAPNAQERIII